MKPISNCLYIVSTPIGNLNDITLRAIEVLKNSDIILCEDTRRSLKLLNHLKFKKKLVSYHKYNEKKQILDIIKHINSGKILSLISDAGTPLISDPGVFLVKECIRNNIKVVPVPGASSITAAMSISGFDDKFLFYGFLPKTENEVKKILFNLSEQLYSIIFFIPATKINFYLKKFKIFFKGRDIMIAREITKIHETIYRGKIDDFKVFKNKVKGELTVVISNSINKKIEINEENILKKAKNYLKKYSLKDTVNLIYETEKVKKNIIYKICLNIKNEKNN